MKIKKIFQAVVKAITRPLAPTKTAPVAAPQQLDRAALRGNEISYVDSYLYGVEPHPYNPDDLVANKGLGVYREMGFDDQIKSALTVKKLAVLTSGFEIREPKYAEDTEASKQAGKEITDFVQFNLEECDGMFNQKLLGVLTALNFGFSCQEIVLKDIDYGPFDGKWGLRDLKTRKPEGFDFRMDAHGNLLPDGILQNH